MEASSNKIPANAEKARAKRGTSLPQSPALPLLLSPLNSTPRQRMVMKMLSKLKVLTRLIKMTKGMKRAVLPNGSTIMAKK